MEGTLVPFVAEVHLQPARAHVEQLGPDSRASPAVKSRCVHAVGEQRSTAHERASPVPAQLRQGEPAEPEVVAEQ